jgi:hypothetical protein
MLRMSKPWCMRSSSDSSRFSASALPRAVRASVARAWRSVAIITIGADGGCSGGRNGYERVCVCVCVCVCVL